MIPIKKGRVSTFVVVRNDRKIIEATMLGHPVFIDGKPKLVEVATDQGRHTLVLHVDTSPLDDTARELLSANQSTLRFHER